MPPRMAKEDAGHYASHEEEEEDVTLSTNPLMQQQPLVPPSPPGPFHPSLRRPARTEATTPRWGALAIMALALLALEASILLGVTDLWLMWGGGGAGGGGGRGAAAVGGGVAAAAAAAGGESCQAPAVMEVAGAAAGPFAGLRQWMGEQHEAAALWKRYNDVVDEYEGFLEEREMAGGARKARGWTLLSAR